MSMNCTTWDGNNKSGVSLFTAGVSDCNIVKESPIKKDKKIAVSKSCSTAALFVVVMHGYLDPLEVTTKR
jgi:hypothetical protein